MSKKIAPLDPHQKITIELELREIDEILRVFRAMKFFFEIFRGTPGRRIFPDFPPGGQFHRGIAVRLRARKKSAGRATSR